MSKDQIFTASAARASDFDFNRESRRGVRRPDRPERTVLPRAAQENIRTAQLQGQIELRRADFNGDLSRADISNATVVTLCWALQFIRPLWRDRFIKWINAGTACGGALVCMEKILTHSSDMNRYFIDVYYEYKARHGYSQEEIVRKREALENVLVPYRSEENVELFRRNGYATVETCFQWFNFAGYLCVKGG